jgi:hypothetical protein
VPLSDFLSGDCCGLNGPIGWWKHCFRQLCWREFLESNKADLKLMLKEK